MRSRTLRRNGRAISEIVGALMLVLIVVVAATALAIFVAQYQKQLQSQEALTHARSLENLAVLHVAAYRMPSTSLWGSLNFTVASLNINPSIIEYVTINNQPLKQYDAVTLNQSTGKFNSTEVGVNGNYTLTLAPREQFNLNVTFDNASVNYSFYNSAYTLPITGFVQINLFTFLQNDFGRVFIPPTAIAVVDPLVTFNGTAYNTVPVLDGSSSFAPVNTTLDDWSWVVSPYGHPSFTLIGEKVVLNVTAPPPIQTYNITLTVSDTDGMIAIGSVEYAT
jgi:flagellin-like protein